MTGSLRFRGRVALPPGRSGDFDHGDVDPSTGRVFVAHTAMGTVDVIDPERLEASGVIEGCPEGSGVVCAGHPRIAFIAARGAGKVLFVDPDHLSVTNEVAVGPKPNGLAWDGGRGQLLVADVDASDQSARLVEASTAEVTARTPLPGRPRWCVYDDSADRFLVNIRDPATLVSLSPVSGEVIDSWPVSSAGPHGLDLDRVHGRAFVACDGGSVVVVDLASGTEVAAITISGEPDAIWFNPLKKRLYVGIGSPGLLDIIDTERAALVESVPTELGAKTSAFDVARQRLYLFLPGSCAAAVYEEV